MDNVQNCDSYINIPSSQIYRCFLEYFYFSLLLCASCIWKTLLMTIQSGADWMVDLNNKTEIFFVRFTGQCFCTDTGESFRKVPLQSVRLRTQHASLRVHFRVMNKKPCDLNSSFLMARIKILFSHKHACFGYTAPMHRMFTMLGWTGIQVMPQSLFDLLFDSTFMSRQQESLQFSVK
jgi:hypothetical protein